MSNASLGGYTGDLSYACSTCGKWTTGPQGSDKNKILCGKCTEKKKGKAMSGDINKESREAFKRGSVAAFESALVAFNKLVKRTNATNFSADQVRNILESMKDTNKKVNDES